MSETYYLSEIQGMIASCAIESKGHDKAYRRISELIKKNSPLNRMEWEDAMDYCYGEGEE